MGQKKLTARHVQVSMLLLLLVTVLVGISLGVSYTGNTGAATTEVAAALVAPFQKTYAAKKAGLPDVVFTALGDEVIQVFVFDKEKYFYRVIEKGKLVLLEEGRVDNPTITVSLSSATLTALQYKEITLTTALQQGKVSLSSPKSIKPDNILLVLESIDISVLTP